jgi:hypothetical protein
MFHTSSTMKSINLENKWQIIDNVKKKKNCGYKLGMHKYFDVLKIALIILDKENICGTFVICEFYILYKY